MVSNKVVNKLIIIIINSTLLKRRSGHVCNTWGASSTPILTEYYIIHTVMHILYPYLETQCTGTNMWLPIEKELTNFVLPTFKKITESL